MTYKDNSRNENRKVFFTLIHEKNTKSWELADSLIPGYIIALFNGKQQQNAAVPQGAAGGQPASSYYHFKLLAPD